MKPKFAILAAAALLGAVSAAQASGTTWSASFSNLQFQVIDLDPSDGIAPSFSIDGLSLTSYAYVNGAQVYGSSSTSVPISLTAGGNAATVTLPASGLAGTSVSSVADLTSPRGVWGVNLESKLTGNITVSAGTQLILLGDAFIDRGYGSHDGDATVELDVNARYVASDLTSTSASLYRASQGSNSQRLAASFTNLGTTPFQAGFIIDTTVNAVPEPASAGLLLAGLGVLGAVARRRRRG